MEGHWIRRGESNWLFDIQVSLFGRLLITSGRKPPDLLVASSLEGGLLMVLLGQIRQISNTEV